MHIKFIFRHHGTIILCCNELLDLIFGHGDAEVEITHEYFTVVIVYIIALILGAPVALVCLLVNLTKLLVSFANIFWKRPTT